MQVFVIKLIERQKVRKNSPQDLCQLLDEFCLEFDNNFMNNRIYLLFIVIWAFLPIY